MGQNELSLQTHVDILTPTFDEEAAVLRCYEAVKGVFESRPNFDYRHTFIDNASSDSTVAIIKEIISRDSKVRLIENAANFGAEKSGYHGILQLDGELFSVVLCDLQTPVQTLGQMLDKWDGGVDAILALKRTDGLKGTDAIRGAYYRMMEFMSDSVHLPGFLGFGLFGARVLTLLKERFESHPYFRGIVPNLPISYSMISYNQPPRKLGKSHHTLEDLTDYFFLGLVVSSTKILKWSILLGLLFGVLSGIVAIGYTIAKLVWWSAIPIGIAPLVIGTFFLGGLILSLQGLLGLYVTRTLEHTQKKPLVIEKSRTNF
jgi:polyisoprenyl-phosphate glycosyltransferase